MRNMFGVEGVVRLLFFSIDDVFWDILIPFLDYLKYLPDVVYSINGKNIHINNYEVDSTIIQKLKEIDEQTNF